MKETMDKILTEGTEKRLRISCDSIEQETKGEWIRGSFQIFAPEGKKIKGRVMVSDPRVECSEAVLRGEEAQISYCFDGSCMEPGETVSGWFDLVTNCGECRLKFSFFRPQKKLDSSLGEIKNLFHFANLAANHWEEALNLYFSPDFEGILANADQEYREIYRGLSGERKEQYMDEFLQAVHKKEAVLYKADRDSIALENIEEDQKIEITVEKHGWGYTQLFVRAEGAFLKLKKEVLAEMDFVQGQCLLPVYICKDKLHQGKNWGEIVFTSPHETFRITILVCQNQHHRMRVAMEKRRNIRRRNMELTNLYMDFRCKNISAFQFQKECEEILEFLQRCDGRNPIARLYAAHLNITQEKWQEAKWQLEKCAKQVQEEKSPEVYAYYLYLTSLLTEEEGYAGEVKEKVKELHLKYENSWQISWLWMYLSRELRSNASKKWEFLKEEFARGCSSPVMYMEAVLLLVYQPTLLTELGKTELKILWFGQKRKMLTQESVGIIQYLSMKQKEFSMPLYRLLAAICEEHEQTEVLEALCSLLIKGNKNEEKYFSWYKKAILAEIRITSLYEYYLMSMDRKKETEIPRAVLLFFSYQPDRSEDCVAYLYRYVHENREQLEDLYISYVPRIERYLQKKLYEGKINRDLGYLYEHFLLSDTFSQEKAEALAKVMFFHEIHWDFKEGDKVILLYGHKKQAEVFEAKRGSVILPVYTENYLLFREDRQGNRFWWKNAPKPEPYIDRSNAAPKIMKWVQDSAGMALYLCSGSREWYRITEEREEYFRFLKDCEEIKTEERMEIRSRLMDFYYEADETDQLDCALEEVLPYSVKKEDRDRLLQYFLSRDLYEKAYEFVKIYDPKKTDPGVLVRICTYMLEEEKGEKEILLWFVLTAFERGKYNLIMLEYLMEQYQGCSRQLKVIYEAARDFEIPAYRLCERILMQILTTGAEIGEEAAIFKDYVSGGTRTEVEAAFLTCRAMEYMRNDREMDPYMVMDIARVHKRGFAFPTVVHLAYLRFFAEHKQERKNGDEEILKEYLQEIVMEKDMMLPFLTEYADMEGMEGLADKMLISYKTLPGKKIVLHYRKILSGGQKENFIREEMREVCFGIYVKECVLFYGEELQYYITEEQENMERMTKNGTIQREDPEETSKNSRYYRINEMSLGHLLQDYDFVYHTMEEYRKMEFLTDNIFHL